MPGTVAHDPPGSTDDVCLEQVGRGTLVSPLSSQSSHRNRMACHTMSGLGVSDYITRNLTRWVRKHMPLEVKGSG